MQAMSRICMRCLSARTTTFHDVLIHKPRQLVIGTSTLLTKTKTINPPLCGRFHTDSRLLRRLHIPDTFTTAVNLMQEKQIRYSDDYIQEKIEEYNLGVRRLATMMGQDPDTFTETDVKNAIRYLFPSPITSKRSRPSLDPPLKIFPMEKQVKCDSEGRPDHYLFYTLADVFYEELDFIYTCLLEAKAIDDERHQKGLAPEEELDLQSSKWLSKDEVTQMYFSTLKGPMYRRLVTQLDRLAQEPYAYKYKSLIMKYREVFKSQTVSQAKSPTVWKGAKGRKYATEKGKRKTAIAEVRLYVKGSGKITVNGEPYNHFFPLIYDRHHVMAPFNLLRLNRCFDVEATVVGGLQGKWSARRSNPSQNPVIPKSAMAGAIRLAIAKAMQPFVRATDFEVLRRGGMLTTDRRTKERKKPGQWKARKKFTWKKR